MNVLTKSEALERLEELRGRILPSGGCLLCALVGGKAVPKPLAENELATLLLDRFGRREGHLLVVTKRHIESVKAFDWETHIAVQELVFAARRALDEILHPVQIYTCTFGATVPLPMSFTHYHTHVIPVFERDERSRPARVLSWSEGVIAYSDAEAEALRARILEGFTASAPG
jgi:diadenosine tetraphosphate (Ap4A) HIT family hydrolase